MKRHAKQLQGKRIPKPTKPIRDLYRKKNLLDDDESLKFVEFFNGKTLGQLVERFGSHAEISIDDGVWGYTVFRLLVPDPETEDEYQMRMNKYLVDMSKYLRQNEEMRQKLIDKLEEERKEIENTIMSLKTGDS